jgi:pilus assembly protein CpaC
MTGGAPYPYGGAPARRPLVPIESHPNRERWKVGHDPAERSSVVHAGGTAPRRRGRAIQQVQNTAESARAVHQLIEAMPTSMEDLTVIERRSQLIITKANVIRMAIADQAVLDVAQYSPREISVIGIARGSTTMTLWFEGHRDPLIYLVRVIRDPELDDQRRIDYGRLEQKLAVLFPNSKVYLIPTSYKLIVRGQARDQEEAANILNIIQGEVVNQDGGLLGPGSLGAGVGGTGAAGAGAGGVGLGGFGAGLWSGYIVNELRVPGEYQINVRCVVAELNRSQARNLGIDWSVMFANGRQMIGSAMGGLAAGGIGAGGAAVGTGGNNLFGVFEEGEIGVFLNWLASNGTATILTEPNLTVLSGRPARFLAGGEFAVPTIVGISGAAGQTTTFRGYGTSVLVTPTVVDRDLIRLTAIAEFSERNNNNTVNNIPGLNTRRIETTVELREGQTLALAGLLSHTQVTEVSRIPFLGDIPKIGPLLFTTKNSAMDETELLILCTPEIVRPMDAHEVPPVPGFEVTYPSDYEFWKYNMTEGLPDTGYYQVPPYGSGSVGTNVGYQHFNPGPGSSLYSPVPTTGGGFTEPPVIEPTPALPVMPPPMSPPPMPPSISAPPKPAPPAFAPLPLERTPTTRTDTRVPLAADISPANFTPPVPQTLTKERAAPAQPKPVERRSSLRVPRRRDN